ncbi:MAG: hydrolase [Legionella sp.]|uniref:hydrolase n=1 Tax=Legionella sp. TaxID=459 RepID=UPI0039E6F2B7
MIKSYQKLVDVICSKQKLMIEQLYQFCEINSGTSNISGLTQILQVLHTAYKPIADEIHLKKSPPLSIINMSSDTVMQQCGDALFIQKRPHLKRRILLSGHMDTVYPQHSPFQKLTYINDNQINGPGVADMKGGLIVMLHALTALEQNEHAKQLGWDVLINADEEIGSPASSVIFDEIAANYQAALVYEPAMTPTGTLAKNRRGSGKFTLIATGKAAHVGRAFAKGRNAICYLAEIITAVHQLNDQREGVTINVGKIAGGEVLNMVPDKAVAKLDVRFSQPEDQQWVNQEFAKILHKFKQQDYTLTIQGAFGRPVKKVCLGTKHLFKRIQSLGKELGLSIDWQDSGGCCDGNNLAQHGLPVLDTLGVRGGNIHSPEEYILLDSLSERAALSALIMLDLAQGGLEDLKHDAISQSS